MAGPVSVQADIGSTAGSSLGLLASAKPLLKALSADDIDPLAVLQIEALGNCFHANGDWASKLPDILARAPSYRLERLSSWIGWEKGDAGSHICRTSGGRAAALICLGLINLYPREKCGFIIQDLCKALVHSDYQNASLTQLSNISQYLGGKLAGLGFGNLLAEQLTRLRQSFFEAGNEIPSDLAVFPTEETLVQFLVLVKEAVRREDLLLRFCGSTSAGPLIAFMLSLSPEDIRIDVQGETIYEGQRKGIVFSIENQHHVTEFHLESLLDIHSERFSRHYISPPSEHLTTATLSFSWSGYLSSALSIALSDFGVADSRRLQTALANLAATAITYLRKDDFKIQDSGESAMPLDGIKSWLGINWATRIRQSLKAVLVEPDDFQVLNLDSCFAELQESVRELISHRHCVCKTCSEEPWHLFQYSVGRLRSSSKQQKACRYARFAPMLGQIISIALCCPIVNVVGIPAVHFHDSGHYLDGVVDALRFRFHQEASPWPFVGPTGFHLELLRLLHPEWRDPVDKICSSSVSSTIFPSTLQYPKLAFPWTVSYILADGRLRDGNSKLAGIVNSPSQKEIPRRQRAKKSLDVVHFPSAVGVHNRLEMSVRIVIKDRNHYLLLQTFVHFAPKQIIQLDFLSIHLGSLSMSPTVECEHNPRSRAIADASVCLTSVLSPLAGAGQVAVTMTHSNEEAQFLCGTADVPSLYQHLCCVSCAVTQARTLGISLVIGGNC